MRKEKIYPKKFKRRTSVRSLRKKYLIITEGHTEKAYLSHFKTSTKLEIVIENPPSTKQLGLVNKAIALRYNRISQDKFDINTDETWVVMDRDLEKANPHDAENFNHAITLAEKNGIQIALSNDSFEIWYLLHFQEVSSAIHRKDLERKLSEHLGRTYKSRNSGLTEDLYSVILANRQSAIKRADRLYDQYINNKAELYDQNPLTTIHLLINKIINEEGFREQ